MGVIVSYVSRKRGLGMLLGRDIGPEQARKAAALVWAAAGWRLEVSWVPRRERRS